MDLHDKFYFLESDIYIESMSRNFNPIYHFTYVDTVSRHVNYIETKYVNEYATHRNPHSLGQNNS